MRNQVSVLLLAVALIGASGAQVRPMRRFDFKRSSLIQGSGRWWRALSAEGRDGTGPPDIVLLVCWPADGSSGYRLGLYEDEDNADHLVTTKSFKDPIKFAKVECVDTTENDLYTENGQDVKVFPRVLFVAKGFEHRHPVTVVWSPGSELGRAITQEAKIFGGDARLLEGTVHGQKPHRQVLIENARASWLPKSERPSWARPGERLRRIWTYGVSGFTAEKWKRA